MKRRLTGLFSLLAVLALALSPAVAAKQEPRIDPKDFAAFVNKTLAQWNVPGVGIAVVKGGKVVLAEGYGLRDVSNKLPATARTIFAIGSSSKAFTGTVLGILVDEGKVKWDKRVRDYLPTFRLQDESAAALMTPRDLLCHRSGLARHDLAWIGSAFSRKELFDRMRFLEPTADFRSIFEYNNFMFMSAGHLAGEVTGSTWEDVVRTRIFEPLGMKDSDLSIRDSRKKPDLALPYGEKEDKIVELPFRDIDAMGPAGSINSNVLDMAQWVLLNLNKGKAGDKQVISEASLAEIHSPQMVIRDGSFRMLERFPEMFSSSYGMGWIITQYRGHPWIHHGGNVDGFTAFVTFFPRDDIGVVVLSNKNGSFVPEIIALNVADRLMGLDQVPWNARYQEMRDKSRAQAEKRKSEGDKDRKMGTHPSHPLEDYAGEYEHPAYGPLTVQKDGDSLRMTRNGMTFTVAHYHFDVFDIETEAIGMKLAFKASFGLDLKGSVASVSIPLGLAPGVKEIVFTRKPEKAEAGQAPAK
jgi:CubicO group peptidase (beta-lactamase class C family)